LIGFELVCVLLPTPPCPGPYELNASVSSQLVAFAYPTVRQYPFHEVAVPFYDAAEPDWTFPQIIHVLSSPAADPLNCKLRFAAFLTYLSAAHFFPPASSVSLFIPLIAGKHHDNFPSR